MKRALCFCLLGLLAGVGVHVGYYRFSLRTEPSPTTLDGELAWMQGELHLTDSQFRRIKQIHVASSAELLALADRVEQMQKELAAFENERRTADRVDFLEFARFVENRRSLDRACSDSTRRVILASADVMTPAQRQRYFGFLKSTLPFSVQTALFNR